jgi:hypothetical protein
VRYNTSMQVQDIIVKKPYLAWYIQDPKQLSDSSVLEHVLSYGDWDDVQKFISIQGMKNTATLFSEHIKTKRSNYPIMIQNYFTKYFAEHA